MNLHATHGDRGYAMAALLVSLAVMAVLMSAILPAWRHQARREKEAELAFRGEQYVRAIALWERRMGPGSRPPTLDILVEQKFLRKKYKDPITGEDFQPVYLGAMAVAGQPGGGRQGGAGRQGGPPPVAVPQQIPGGRAGNPGIIGVRSRSTAESIRIYNGATRYNQWRFDHAGATQMPGGGVGPGTPVPGGRGGRMGPGGGRVGPGGGRMGPGGGRMGPGGGRIGPGGQGGRGAQFPPPGGGPDR